MPRHPSWTHPLRVGCHTEQSNRMSTRIGGAFPLLLLIPNRNCTTVVSDHRLAYIAKVFLARNRPYARETTIGLGGDDGNTIQNTTVDISHKCYVKEISLPDSVPDQERRRISLLNAFMQQGFLC
jgi:hypothetical protein